MTAKFAIDRSKEMIHVSYSGFVTSNDTMTNFEQALEHPDWSPEFNVFVDMSELSGTDIDFRQMLGIIHRKAPHLQAAAKARMAIWAPTDLAFAVGRMYATLAADAVQLETDVFRDKQEALDFIDN